MNNGTKEGQIEARPVGEFKETMAEVVQAHNAQRTEKKRE